MNTVLVLDTLLNISSRNNFLIERHATENKCSKGSVWLIGAHTGPPAVLTYVQNEPYEIFGAHYGSKGLNGILKGSLRLT